ncbi:efflux transporter outer membrane subunit [Desertivirga arenae]|uniref:efflux transporter outer membrane subunit n=1 Tax=Desertivirga arenae TaxID=2810309 RepID=UPI001A95CAC4|nr:efflux transporter outer membrane subunit [Pedobacter sp. SYSU D00823]
MNFNKFFSYSALLLALVVGSCKVGKNYSRPTVLVQQNFEGQSFSDTSSIADIKWNEFFKDKFLQVLIDSALRNNNNLGIALKRIDAAEEQFKQSKLLLLPQLNAQVTGSYNRFSDNSLTGLNASQFGINAIENYNASLNLSWDVIAWGKLRRQKEAIAADYFQTYEATKAVQTRLVSDVAQGYYNLLMLDQQLAIARRNLQLNDSTLRLTSLLQQSGDVTSLAVQQAEARRQATALLIPQLEQSIALQENALKLLTGRLPGTVERNLSGALDGTAIDTKTGLPAAVVSRRPDIRASELALKAANARAGVAQANLYPSLSLLGSAGVESFKFDNWFKTPASLFGIASGSVLQPILRNRTLKTQFEVAKIEREQAVLRFRESVLVAMTEVSNALVQNRKLAEQAEIAQQQVQTLKQSISNANLLFKSDMANYLEVITAQSNALQAELNLVAVQRQRNGALVELYRALGGGWK